MNSIAISSSTRLAVGISVEVEFWSIEVDGKQLTPDAHPFTASDSEIILFECAECYHCGQPEVLVRKYNDRQVIWFPKLVPDHPSRIPAGEFFLFDATVYDKTVGGCSAELSYIMHDDFEHLMPLYKPHDPKESLYTTPELKADRLGERTLKTLDYMFSLGEFRASMAPESYNTLKIGLDRPSFPEASIHFGMIDDRIVFQFAEHPFIPIWIQFANNLNPFHDIFRTDDLSG